MSKVNSFLTQRLKQASKTLSKMTGLAELSASGNLSSFSGVFRIHALSEKEHAEIQDILASYCSQEQDTAQDFHELINITAEVKAINNQAAILHGERIKKAQNVLKKYRDGAFTAWLMITYGNRQTPYNFLHYYELYTSLPQPLHPKIEKMPRQAVYTLASREGELSKKEAIIQNYQGEPKEELLSLIRDVFPLEESDKRKQNLAEQALIVLSKLHVQFQKKSFRPSTKEKQKLQDLLHLLHSLIS